MAKTKKAKRFVVICTDRRGVFFGRLESQSPPPPGQQLSSAVLVEARNCLYWTRAEKGVLGLAATGPSSGCRIGPAVPRLELAAVAATIDCTPAAVAAWQAAPWQAAPW
jgi:hypothetical protein